LAQLGKGYAYDVAWSADGDILAVAASFSIGFYNTSNYELAVRFNFSARHLAFDPTGRNLVTVAGERLSWIDMSTGLVWRDQSTGMDEVSDLQFSPHGSCLALLGNDCATCGDPNYVLHVINATTGETQFSRTDYGWYSGMSFSPDGRTLAIGNEFDTMLFDSATGAILVDLHHPSPSTFSPAFTADGTQLIIQTPGARLALADPATGRVTRQLSTPASGRYMLSPDGGTLALIREVVTHSVVTHHLEFWDLKADQSLGITEIHADPASFAFSQTGDRMAVATYDQEVRLVGVPRAAPIANIPYDAAILKLAFLPASGSPDIEYPLLGVDSDGRIAVRNALALDLVALDRQVERRPDAVALSADGAWLAFANRNNAIVIQALGTGAVIATLRCQLEPWPEALAFSQDGRYFGADCDGLTIWDTTTWQIVAQRRNHWFLIPASDGTLYSMTLSGQAYRLVNVVTEAVLLEMELPADLPSNDLGDWALSADMQYVALGMGDGYIVVWRVGQPGPWRILHGHEPLYGEGVVVGVREVVFSPTSNVLVSTGVDGTLRFWNSDTGTALRVVDTDAFSASNLAFSPDGRYLAGSTGGTIRVWGLPAP
jgi:WD40 repeat protein